MVARILTLKLGLIGGGRVPVLAEAPVGDFEHPGAVHHAVAALEAAVRSDGGAM